MTVLVVLYVVAAFVHLGVCLAAQVDAHWRTRRDAARLAFAAPVWPVALVWLLVRGVRSLWRTAAWGKGARR